MPSKRFWAKNNPDLDYTETVEKTDFFINNYTFKKFIQISSVSARCQLDTVYGLNKKKSEDLILKNSNNLIVRLGPVYGKGLNKGVLIDMLNNKTVYINGSSKYSFTNVEWIIEWIIKNMNNYVGIKEIGSKDFFILSELSKTLNSKSKFDGTIDDQIIVDKENYNSKSYEVLSFLKNYEHS